MARRASSARRTPIATATNRVLGASLNSLSAPHRTVMAAAFSIRSPTFNSVQAVFTRRLAVTMERRAKSVDRASVSPYLAAASVRDRLHAPLTIVRGVALATSALSVCKTSPAARVGLFARIATRTVRPAWATSVSRSVVVRAQESESRTHLAVFPSTPQADGRYIYWEGCPTAR